MEIIRKIFGELANNCYIVFSEETKAAYVIDPGYEAGKLYEVIKKRGLNVKGIILTHFHYDHADAADELRKLTGTKTYIHKKDVKHLKAKHDVLISEGHVFDFSDEDTLEVIHTAGHTKGGITLIDRRGKNAFTGDTLFPTDTGFVTFEGGSGEDMMASLKKLDKILTDDYMIWPGHEDNVPMSYVREHNKEFNTYLSGSIPE